MTKTYVGTKIVTAWPQTQTINRGASTVEDPGYAVKYADGYISWSPESAFDAAYLELPDVSGLQPHQIRVVAEYVELKNRTVKLRAFLDTTTFADLHEYERDRLTRQYGLMADLAEVLSDRIEAFREPVSVEDGGDVDEVDTEVDPAAENEDRPLAEVLQASADKIEVSSELQAALDRARERHERQFPLIVQNLLDIAAWLEAGAHGPIPTYADARQRLGKPLTDETFDIDAEHNARHEELHPIVIAYQESDIAETFGVGLDTFMSATEEQREWLLTAAKLIKRRRVTISLDPADPDPSATVTAYVKNVRDGALETLVVVRAD